MNAIALRVDGGVSLNDNSVASLSAMVQRAATQLAGASGAAEVLDAKSNAAFAYDAAKATARLAKSRGAFDEVMSSIYRAQADALEIEAMAKRRIADAYEEAQRDGLATTGSVRTDIREGSPDVRKLTISELGLSKDDIKDGRRIRAIEESEPGFIKRALDRMVESGEPPTKTAVGIEINTRLNSFSGDNEWYTPARYVDLARQVMGTIDVDPASNAHAQRTINAAIHYTAVNSGLDKEWHGTVWMNPPYSHPEVQQFAEKIICEIAAGRTTEAIVLTNNSGDTAWHHALAEASTARCITRVRIRFESTTRQSGAGAMGQCFFYFGDDVDRFADVFSDIGRIEVNYVRSN